MASKKRIISILAVGLFSWVGALFFPLDALMVPTWYDHLTFVPKSPNYERTVRVCVSDFEVVAPGVLSFKVEGARRVGWMVGQEFVMAAEDFSLARNEERCPRR